MSSWMLKDTCFGIVPEWNIGVVNSTSSYLKVHVITKLFEWSSVRI